MVMVLVQVMVTIYVMDLILLAGLQTMQTVMITVQPITMTVPVNVMEARR